MKSAKGLGLVLAAGLTATAVLASCKKPATEPETAAPAAPAMALPAGATEQMSAPTQSPAVPAPAPAPAAQPAPAAPSH